MDNSSILKKFATSLFVATLLLSCIAIGQHSYANADDSSRPKEIYDEDQPHIKSRVSESMTNQVLTPTNRQKINEPVFSRESRGSTTRNKMGTSDSDAFSPSYDSPDLHTMSNIKTKNDASDQSQLSNRQPAFSRNSDGVISATPNDVFMKDNTLKVGEEAISREGGSALEMKNDAGVLNYATVNSNESPNAPSISAVESTVGQSNQHREAFAIKEHDPAVDTAAQSDSYPGYLYDNENELNLVLQELEKLDDADLELLDFLISLHAADNELEDDIDAMNKSDDDSPDIANDYSFSSFLEDLLQLDDEKNQETDTVQFLSDINPHVKEPMSAACQGTNDQQDCNDLNANLNRNDIEQIDLNFLNSLNSFNELLERRLEDIENSDITDEILSAYINLIDKYDLLDESANHGNENVEPSTNSTLLNDSNFSTGDNEQNDNIVVPNSTPSSSIFSQKNENNSGVSDNPIGISPIAADKNKADSPSLQGDILKQKMYNCVDFNAFPEKCMQSGRCMYVNEAMLNENSDLSNSQQLSRCRVSPAHMNYLADTRCKKESRGQLLTVAKDLHNEAYLDYATFSFLTSSQDAELLCRALTHAYFSNARTTGENTKQNTNSWKAMTQNEKLKAILDLADEI